MKMSEIKYLLKKYMLVVIFLTSTLAGGTTINVSSYGVTGDGTTDDSVALQAAFDAAAAQSATLLIPANYTIRTTKNLFIYGTVDIRGEGDSSIILCDADLANDVGRGYWISVGITRHKNNGGVQSTFTGTIDNLSIAASSNAKFRRGLWIFNTSSCVISNIFFDFRNAVAGSDVALFGAVESGNNYYWEPVGAKLIENITITNNIFVANHSKNGSEGFGVNSAKNVVISDNFVYGVGDDPIAGHNVENLTIRNNVCYSIDGRILVNNCVNVNIIDNYCERIPEYGTQWFGGGALIYSALEANNSWAAPANITIKDNYLFLPAAVPSGTYGIRLMGVRTATVDSNILITDTSSGGGGINIEADTAYPGWTDPDGLDTDGIARPRDTEIINNLCSGLYPGSIYQNGLTSYFPGTFYNVFGNTAGSYQWYTANSACMNGNILSGGDYIDYQNALTAISDPVIHFTDSIDNIVPSIVYLSGTAEYTAIRRGRIAGYEVQLDQTITAGTIFVQLYKNDVQVSLSNIYNTGTIYLNKADPNLAFEPGDVFTLKARGYSTLLPDDGIKLDITVKGLESTLALDLKFDGNSGATAIDSSGNGNAGIITGAVRTPGIQQGALYFDGSDSVTVSDHASLDITDNLSIAFWINASDYPAGYAGYPIEKRTDTTDANFACYYHGNAAGINKGLLLFVANAGGNWTQISANNYILPQNEWVHIALVYTAVNGGQLYINGEPYGSPKGGGTLAINSADLKIGRELKGNIHDVRVYDRALSPLEIKGIYYIDQKP
ncbi:MAG: hypothetical protein L3J71_09210 [Victivallaceae bacterium]|nr:hypothetical protein [Victivallaceae bacterium]